MCWEHRAEGTTETVGPHVFHAHSIPRNDTVDSSAWAYSQRKPQPGWGSWTPQTERSSQKLLHHCGFHRSIQNTAAGRIVPFSGFPVRTSYLKHGFVTEKIWASRQMGHCQIVSLRISENWSVCKRVHKLVWKSLFPLITDDFFPEGKRRHEPTQGMGSGEELHVHILSRQGLFFFFFLLAMLCSFQDLSSPRFSSVA